MLLLMQAGRARGLRLAGLLLLALLLLWFGYGRRAGRRSPPGGQMTQAEAERLAGFLTALEARENQAAETVWAAESLAQRHGQVVDALWDTLNAATNKLAALADFPIQEIVPPQWGAVNQAPLGVEVRAATGPGPAWSAATGRQFLGGLNAEGWRLTQIEFRHNQFLPGADARSAASIYDLRADLVRPSTRDRATIEGNLRLRWGPAPTPDLAPTVEQADARGLTLKTRRGEPPLREALYEEIEPPEKSFWIDPLILYDLDGDGASEIILASKNRVYHRQPDGRFTSAALCDTPPGPIFTAVVADFDQDGAADFLCARFEGLVLFPGTPRGTFPGAGRLVWSASPRLKYAQALTCGDVDGDGDLDVWLAQYKGPFERGQMPTPYYDANDGHPAYLLLNDGRGNFTDATANAGLDRKRSRRTYSSSLVDLDGDGDLDLIVVSDFAGIDLYANDGKGHFTDVTAQWLSEAHAFGMAHAVADFDGDGRVDFLVTGMHCPTPQRLDALGLRRPGFQVQDAMRERMTSGNRLCVARAEGGFRQTPLSQSIAHSGWSWGCSAFDLDNDGFPEVYVANGHESKESVQDYEPEFWLHDIYVASSKDDIVASAYFGGKNQRTRARGESYGGYEKNRLFLNQHGVSFLEAGHLMGVALEQDSRNVAADDLDGDGRADLLVTTFEVWPARKQTLRVFQNLAQPAGNWLGVHLREEGGGFSPVGARVTLHYSGRTAVHAILTGDSHRCQSATTAHFGLGQATEVESLEVRWLNGRSVTVAHPGINRYHTVHPNR